MARTSSVCRLFTLCQALGVVARARRACRRRPLPATACQLLAAHGVQECAAVRAGQGSTVSPRRRYGRCGRALPSGPDGRRRPFGWGIAAGAALSALFPGGGRFFRPRRPAAPSPCLTVGLPRRWGTAGFPRCQCRRGWSGSVESVPRCASWMSSLPGACSDPAHVPVWSWPVSLFGHVAFTRFSEDSARAFHLSGLPSSPSTARLAEVGPWSPELRTSDDSSARLGRDTRTSRGATWCLLSFFDPASQTF